MHDETRAFAATLRACQRGANLSDRELALRLGWSQSYLSRLKRPDWKPHLSLAFARRAAGVFPELAIFLTPIVHRSKETVSTIPTETEGAGR